MIKESGMIKASELKVGDKIFNVGGMEYEVIENHVGDVLFIHANMVKEIMSITEYTYSMMILII